MNHNDYALGIADEFLAGLYDNNQGARKLLARELELARMVSFCLPSALGKNWAYVECCADQVAKQAEYLRRLSPMPTQQLSPAVNSLFLDAIMVTRFGGWKVRGAITSSKRIMLGMSYQLAILHLLWRCIGQSADQFLAPDNHDATYLRRLFGMPDLQLDEADDLPF